MFKVGDFVHIKEGYGLIKNIQTISDVTIYSVQLFHVENASRFVKDNLVVGVTNVEDGTIYIQKELEEKETDLNNLKTMLRSNYDNLFRFLDLQEYNIGDFVYFIRYNYYNENCSGFGTIENIEVEYSSNSVYPTTWVSINVQYDDNGNPVERKDKVDLKHVLPAKERLESTIKKLTEKIKKYDNIKDEIEMNMIETTKDLETK